MDALGWFVAAIVAATVVLPFVCIVGFVSARRRARRGAAPSGAAVLGGAFDEFFHPSAADARLIIEEQRRARVAVPAPGDPPGEVFDGRVVIEVPEP
ncbi:hypothetical protein [Microbacterium sp.]|uniref:hypothetical protein n=1 Tax=Microbacterium sp. TaxID=51671 RepID=UPI0037C5A8EC